MRSTVRLLAVAALALAAAGCGGAAAASGPSTSGTSVGNGGGKRETVKLHVVKGRKGATLALAAVRIDGKGPFVFAIDTGAARSLVARSVAKKLGLDLKGSHPVSGVACSTKAASVHLAHWSVGGVTLPSRTVDSVSLPGQSGKKLQGLIGSDVLSTYGAVQIDYQHQRLVLRARTQG